MTSSVVSIYIAPPPIEMTHAGGHQIRHFNPHETESSDEDRMKTINERAEQERLDGIAKQAAEVAQRAINRRYNLTFNAFVTSINQLAITILTSLIYSGSDYQSTDDNTSMCVFTYFTLIPCVASVILNYTHEEANSNLEAARITHRFGFATLTGIGIYGLTQVPTFSAPSKVMLGQAAFYAYQMIPSVQEKAERFCGFIRSKIRSCLSGSSVN